MVEQPVAYSLKRSSERSPNASDTKAMSFTCIDLIVRSNHRPKQESDIDQQHHHTSQSNTYEQHPPSNNTTGSTAYRIQQETSTHNFRRIPYTLPHPPPQFWHRCNMQPPQNHQTAVMDGSLLGRMEQSDPEVRCSSCNEDILPGDVLQMYCCTKYIHQKCATKWYEGCRRRNGSRACIRCSASMNVDSDFQETYAGVRQRIWSKMATKVQLLSRLEEQTTADFVKLLHYQPLYGQPPSMMRSAFYNRVSKALASDQQISKELLEKPNLDILQYWYRILKEEDRSDLFNDWLSAGDLLWLDLKNEEELLDEPAGGPEDNPSLLIVCGFLRHEEEARSSIARTA